jgi:hypothetical protein
MDVVHVHDRSGCEMRQDLEYQVVDVASDLRHMSGIDDQHVARGELAEKPDIDVLDRHRANVEVVVGGQLTKQLRIRLDECAADGSVEEQLVDVKQGA